MKTHGYYNKEDLLHELKHLDFSKLTELKIEKCGEDEFKLSDDYQSSEPITPINELEQEFEDKIDGDPRNIEGAMFDDECGDR